MNKLELPKLYFVRPQDLPDSVFLVSPKLDGVQVIITQGAVAMSRANKSLYNVPTANLCVDTIYEYFNTNWETSVSDLRTKNNGTLTDPQCYFKIFDRVDGFGCKPQQVLTKAQTLVCYEDYRKQGHEGLVAIDMLTLKAYKLKPIDTTDVVVDSWFLGKGKHEGKLGGVITKFGKVGTGFTDHQRETYPLDDFIVGKVIEVESMGFTPSGKFRHPRFLRLREDKS